MTPLCLTKYHGLGNDFLVALGPAPSLDSVTARRLCDRRRGIGADGCILGQRADPASGAVLSFRLWNADGGEAEMSGNGVRCLAQAALDAGWVADGERFGVLSPAGLREVSLRPRDSVTHAEVWSEVEMGVAKVGGEADRCNVGHGQLLVDMGNPHLVVVGSDPASVDVAALGALLEATDPEGLNVEFVTLGPGPDEVTMRVWERGVGETLACGTGSCAAAVALHHWGRVGPVVTVHQPGGSAVVGLRPDGTVTLAGPSQRVARCVVD